MTVNQVAANTQVKTDIGITPGMAKETGVVDESFFNEFMLALKCIAGEISDTNEEEEEMAEYMFPMFVPMNIENHMEMDLSEEQTHTLEIGDDVLEQVSFGNEGMTEFVPAEDNVSDLEFTEDVTFEEMFPFERKETEVVGTRPESADVKDVKFEPVKTHQADSRENRPIVAGTHKKEEMPDMTYNGVEEKAPVDVEFKVLTETRNITKPDNEVDNEKSNEIRIQKDKTEHANVERFEIGVPHNTFEVETENVSVTRTHVVESMNRITQTIVESISQRETGETVELKIRLKPEFLGEVEITLEETSGKVRAFLKISNEDLREALNQRVVEIETILKNQGIEMDRIEFGSFAFQLDAESPGSHGKQGNNRRPSFGYHIEKKDAHEEEFKNFAANGRINYLV